MAPRRISTIRSRPVTPFDDDRVSQNSKTPESDDRDLEVYARAITDFKVSWQKQKREKENKMLQDTQAELDEHLINKEKEIEGTVKAMDEAYQDFLTQYATIEDKQREVITKIIETQNTLLSLSVKRHQKVIKLNQEAEDGQLEGMSQVKQACKDFVEIRDALTIV
ncbi:hypothetical protein PAXRUDRAFT_494344 [Paxillus rubicundulus Ve08.2h10]|uniref:Uncharacterized protein n=1 Tax=Paxillus rubicundulus Ve08.2h10 TaxID=930991 RepID=A0A0D0E112_9AGAM|nr:hypothetical protein PAXRUDRAFT_494344 [Paxillus rubicundulus Ve08.2h10]